MRRSLAIAANLGLAAYLGLSAIVHADSWRLRELPAPPPGWINVKPQAINSTGKIVGDYRLQGDVLFRAFLFDGTNWMVLPTLGGNYGFADAVNNRGEIVGWSETDFLTTECFTPPRGSEYCFGERHVLGKRLS